jgi:hypothetical protein
MKHQDFNCSITTNVTAEEAMEAISRVQDWWVTNFEGASQKLGDVFTARVGGTFVTFNITEFIPDSKIVWTVTNCYFPWLRDKTEWMGTKIIFEVSNENNLTTINLTHLGLVPKNEGYDNFVKGWKVYVQGSLLKLLNESIGQPT